MAFIPCPSYLELEEKIVYKAGLPVLAFQDAIPTPEPYDASLDDSLREIVDEHPERDVDNSTKDWRTRRAASKFDRPLSADKHLEVDHVDLSAFEGEGVCRLLSSGLICQWAQENKPQHTSTWQAKKWPSQLEKIARSGWMQARRKSATRPQKRSDDHNVGTLGPIDPPGWDRLRSRATIEGYHYIELPATMCG